MVAVELIQTQEAVLALHQLTEKWNVLGLFLKGQVDVEQSSVEGLCYYFYFLGVGKELMTEAQSNHLQLLISLHRLSEDLLKMLHLLWHFVDGMRAARQYKRIVIHQLFYLWNLSFQYLIRLPLISWIIKNPCKKSIDMNLGLQPVLVERGCAKIDDSYLPLGQYNSFLFSALQQIYCFHQSCFLLQAEGVGFYVEQVRAFQDLEGIVIQASYEDDFVVDLGQLAREEQ